LELEWFSATFVALCPAQMLAARICFELAGTNEDHRFRQVRDQGFGEFGRACILKNPWSFGLMGGLEQPESP
jgi:hypothetical protein